MNHSSVQMYPPPPSSFTTLPTLYSQQPFSSTPLFLTFPQPQFPSTLSDQPLYPPGADPYGISALYAGYETQTKDSQDPNAVSQNWIVKQTEPVRYGAAIQSLHETSVASTSLHAAWKDNSTTQHFTNDTTVILPNQTKVIKSMRCEVCKIDCNSKDVFEKHISGKKHKKNLQSQTNPTNTVLSGTSHASSQSQMSSIHGQVLTGVVGKELESKRKDLSGGAVVDSVRVCTICKIVCNSQDVFSKHLAGKKHAAKASYSFALVCNCLTKMSNSSRRDSDTSFDVEELLRIGTRCRELRSEKDMLKSSQSQRFELIRVLELHEKSISEAHTEDKRHIERLEKELLNCSQEIDYLQDQLNMRNAEVNYLDERVQSLKLKLEETENLQEEVCKLREELQRSNSEQFFLIQEVETKEMELQKSTLSIEKLEESISSMALESQCEVESMKLDMMTLEQNCFEAKKIQEETVQEKIRMSRLIEELQVVFQDAQETIISLNEENMELKEKLNAAKMNTKFFSEKVEEWLEKKDGSQSNSQSSLSEQACNPTISKNISAYGEVLGPLLARLETVLKSDSCLKGEMEKMPSQMQEYEFLVEKLKEELKEEKLKAKEEAEDLAQEMAELRYQITGLLEEECKRRACIEQASLQRIAELEAQLQREQRKPLISVRHLPEASF